MSQVCNKRLCHPSKADALRSGNQALKCKVCRMWHAVQPKPVVPAQPGTSLTRQADK